MPRTRSAAAITGALAVLLAMACAPVAAPTQGESPTRATGSFGPAGSLAEARVDHSSTLLLDGRVLVVGGDGGTTLASTEQWDPAVEAFRSAESLAQARKWHTATVLHDGRILVVGGLGNNRGNEGDFLASAEVWDVDSSSFSSGGTLAETRISHTATLLADGGVLVVGGVLVSIAALASAERWDPPTESFGPAGSLAEASSDHTATILPDGRVLVVGGGAFTADSFETRASAALWDPATGAFGPTGPLAQGRMSHTATLLPDGGVLIIGGSARTADGFATIASAERWDPGTGSFGPAGSLAEARSDHTTTLLPDGRVLVVGGGVPSPGGYAVRSSAELWDPVTRLFAPTGSLTEARMSHTATLLPDGRVLVVGGTGTDGAPIALAEMYELDSR